MEELYAKEYAEFITVTCLDWKLVLSDDRVQQVISQCFACWKGSGLELPRKEIAKFEVRHLAKRMMVHTPCLRLFAKRYETFPAEKL